MAPPESLHQSLTWIVRVYHAADRLIDCVNSREISKYQRRCRIVNDIPIPLLDVFPKLPMASDHVSDSTATPRPAFKPSAGDEFVSLAFGRIQKALIQLRKTLAQSLIVVQEEAASALRDPFLLPLLEIRRSLNGLSRKQERVERMEKEFAADQGIQLRKSRIHQVQGGCFVRVILRDDIGQHDWILFLEAAGKLKCALDKPPQHVPATPLDGQESQRPKPKKLKRKRGRPLGSDNPEVAKLHKRILNAWDTNAYRTRADCANALGCEESEVDYAIRKREKTRQKKFI